MHPQIRYTIFLTLLLIIVLFSCKEIYKHDPRHPEELIIVDGLITDSMGPHLVKLSHVQVVENDPVLYESFYAPAGHHEYLTGATVVVADDKGNSHFFRENRPGHYYSDAGFAGVPGTGYKLIIDTPSGDKYESSIQMMPEPVNMDSIYTVKQIREMLLLSGQGTYFRHLVPGVNIFADFRGNDGNRPLFRLVPRFMLLYTETFADVEHYRWKKLYLPDDVNVNRQTFEHGTNIIRNHEVAFISLREQDLYLDKDLGENAHRRLLLFKKYSLNKDAWDFYSAANEQINSRGRLFDPLEKQLPSNVYCINDPGKVVTGLFEVSPVMMRTYMIVEMPWDDLYPLKEIGDLHHLPDRGVSYFTAPDFWVY